jgi:uncharacterized protein (TIGR03067 family)
MKRQHFGFALIVLVVLTGLGCVSAPIVSRWAVNGTWEAIDDGDRGVITLSRDKTAVMQLGKDTYGGEDAEMDGKPYRLVYKIDYSKSPAWIDFIMIEKKTGLEMSRIKGIFTYLTKDQILLCLSFRAGGRPQYFEESEYNDTLTLSRL